MGVCPCSVSHPHTGRRSQGIDSGHSYLRSSKTPQVLSGCPVVADYHRLFVGNAHVSCCGRGRFRWSARCRPWSVNPSRKLRRFESFTCHRVRERAPDLRKRGPEALLVYPMRVSKRRRLAVLRTLGRRPVTCVNAQTESGGAESARNTPGSSGPRHRAGRTLAALTCGDVGGGGM